MNLSLGLRDIERARTRLHAGETNVDETISEYSGVFATYFDWMNKNRRATECFYENLPVAVLFPRLFLMNAS